MSSEIRTATAAGVKNGPSGLAEHCLVGFCNNPVRNNIRRYEMTIAQVLGLLAAGMLLSTEIMAAEFPDPAVDDKSLKGDQTAVLAGGCFWCVEAVFQQIEGVKKVVSGYSGGDAATANYETVSSGSTGHAESVKVTFDPQKITYGQILKVFFDVAHDPTQLNRQGPDVGRQY